MTDEQAHNLRRGDTVEIRMRGAGGGLPAVLWLAGLVTSLEVHMGGDDDPVIVLVNVRTPVQTQPGERYRYHQRNAEEVRYPRLDPTAANVFADWLEDHGEYKAAIMLRKEFPAVDAQGNLLA